MTTSYICSALRTPIGSFNGSLSSVSAPILASECIKSLFKESRVDPEVCEEVILGSVLTAGVGQAPARQAALAAGLSQNVPCTTIGKVCGSGLKSVMLADQAIRCGDSDLIVAGGMENMSQSPYLVPKMRTGLRLGHGQLLDSMIHDGLWDPYNNFHMGCAAESCVKEYQLSREAQDNYAALSYKRAQQSIEKGLFEDEIVGIDVKVKKDTIKIEKDEEPFRGNIEKLGSLRAVFDKEGSVTAGNASTLNDGAAALIIASEAFVKKHSLKPLAKIVSSNSSAKEPVQFTTAPAKSIQNLLDKSKLKTSDIDLWEINEAFAAVALANMQILNLNESNVNIRGGAVALGHPIGASGARILCTLLHSLKKENKKHGIASLCIGGGEAVSVLVENLL